MKYYISSFVRIEIALQARSKYQDVDSGKITYINRRVVLTNGNPEPQG
jgi:hypothetical protein